MTLFAFWAAVAIAGIGLGLARRGRVDALLETPFRGGPLLIGLLAADLILLPRIAAIPVVEPALGWLSLATVSGLVIVALLNWTVLRPLPAWLLGFGLNAAYLLANGGRAYLVRPAAFASAETPIALPDFVALPLLAAWIPLPPDSWLSPGDLVLAIATIWTIQGAMRRRPA